MSKRKTNVIAWTDKHAREADARLLELAAWVVRNGPSFGTAGFALARMVSSGMLNDTTERRFRLALKEDIGLKRSAIDREVRRVCARAEGRCAETADRCYRVLHPDGRYEGPGDECVSDPGAAWFSGREHAHRVAACIEGGIVLRVSKKSTRYRRRP
jgi:hypothetical protein